MIAFESWFETNKISLEEVFKFEQPKEAKTSSKEEFKAWARKFYDEWEIVII